MGVVSEGDVYVVNSWAAFEFWRLMRKDYNVH